MRRKGAGLIPLVLVSVVLGVGQTRHRPAPNRPYEAQLQEDS